MPRVKLTIAYDGSGFHGWQRQEPPGREPLRTVQGVMEQAFMRLLRHPVTITGASRTDSGVHALGQVAHLDTTTPIPPERLADAMNSRLPEDIEVRRAETVLDTFHAIRDVASKQYQYRIFNASRRPLLRRHMVCHTWQPLDARAMDAAAFRLVGTHDFEGFAAAGHGRESTVRTIHRCTTHREQDDVLITVEGDGFLWNMVRIIAGTLVEVGRGKFEPSRIDDILATTDRQLAGPTLPPQGLCLVWIAYAKGVESPGHEGTEGVGPT
jgi:tRNA pseudouridine38-40 synthase